MEDALDSLLDLPLDPNELRDGADSDQGSDSEGSNEPIPPPPPLQRFPSLDAAWQSLQAFAQSNGFAVVKRRSRPDRQTGEVQAVDVSCDRGMATTSHSTGARKTRSRRIGCPFKAGIRFYKTFGEWRLIVHDPTHNHGGASASSLPSFRRAALKRHHNQIAAMLHQSLPPRQIISILEFQDPNTPIRARDIYNLRHRLDTGLLGGRTPVEGLISALSENEWCRRYSAEQGAHGPAIFCSHVAAAQMIARNPYFLALDCSLKLARYNMSLLNITGVSARNQPFFVGFGFISDKREASYRFILEGLAEIYTRLGLPPPLTVLVEKDESLINASQAVWPQVKVVHCIARINKEILKYAKVAIHQQLRANPPVTNEGVPVTNKEYTDEVDRRWKEMLKSWMDVVWAPTTQEHSDQWESFKNEYNDPAYQPLVTYMETEWLRPVVRTRFLRCYTDTYTHFGQVATPRTDAPSRMIKRELETSTNDVSKGVKTIGRMLAKQYTESLQELEDEKQRRSTHLMIPLFRDVLQHVSGHALNKAFKILREYLPESPYKPRIQPCTGITTTTFGVPCIHTMQRYYAVDTPVPLNEFHKQWYLSQVPIPPPDWSQLVREPAVVDLGDSPQNAESRGGISCGRQGQQAVDPEDPVFLE